MASDYHGIDYYQCILWSGRIPQWQLNRCVYLIGKKYLEEKKVTGKDFIPNPEGINQHKGKKSDDERLEGQNVLLTSKDNKSKKGSKPKPNHMIHLNPLAKILKS